MTKQSQAGNVFFIVMVGIALFAALSFTVSRSTNTKSTDILSAKTAELAATEIMDYAQNIARTTNRLVSKGCSENELSFEPPSFDGSSAYTNSNSPGDFSCHIFNQQGGAAKYQTFNPDFKVNTTNAWHPSITATTCIPGIGTGENEDCVDDSNDRNNEILLFVDNIKETICTDINQTLNTYNEAITYTPSLTEFDGDFAENSGSISKSDLEDHYITKDSGCIINTDGTRYYYKVLLAR